MSQKIYVIGAGTWGLALARILDKAGHKVSVYSVHEETRKQLEETRTYRNLPGVVFADSIRFTGNPETVREADAVLVAIPSIYLRQTLKLFAPYLKGKLVINATKGLEEHTKLTMSEVIRDVLGDLPVVVFSGPTHAEEVAWDLPTAVVAACEDTETAKQVVQLFEGTCMRVYTNTDVRGVEMCGALKNIIALATGIADGLGFGDNMKAAILTRGIAEMRRLGHAMGCCETTFSGLSGIGDLIVTATSQHSRNNRCGRLLGQGVPVQEAVARIGMVVEGLNALPAAVEIAEEYQVEMPILEAVHAVVSGGDARILAERLMSRPSRDENV